MLTGVGSFKRDFRRFGVLVCRGCCGEVGFFVDI